MHRSPRWTVRFPRPDSRLPIPLSEWFAVNQTALIRREGAPMDSGSPSEKIPALKRIPFQNLNRTDARNRCRIRGRGRDLANRSKPKNGFVWREAPERFTFRLLTLGVRRLARALKPVSAEDTPFRKAGASATHSKGNAATNPEPVVRKRTGMPSKFDIGFVSGNCHVHDESVACPQSLTLGSFRETVMSTMNVSPEVECAVPRRHGFCRVCP